MVNNKNSRADVEVGSVFLVAEDGMLLSLPIPSNSPDDPLGWSVTRRALVGSVTFLFAALAMAIQQFPGLLWLAFAKEFGLTKTKVDDTLSLDLLRTLPSLFMGLGGLIWLPLSIWLGRRPVLLICALLLPIMSMWASLSSSLNELMAALALQGLANGATLSTILTIVDLTFIHQRPGAMAAFWGGGYATTQLILALTPLTVDTATDWRTPYRLASYTAIAVFVLALFLVLETYFVRPPVAVDGRILVQDSAEKVRIYDGWDEVAGGGLPVVSNERGFQKHAVKAAPTVRIKPTFTTTTTDTRAMNKPEIDWDGCGGGDGGWRDSAKLWLRQRRIRRVPGGDWRSALAFYPQAVICMLNPLVFWMCLFSAVNFAGNVVIGVTGSMVLESSEYSLPARSMALMRLAAAFGALLAWPASGFLVSQSTYSLSLRSGGVRHAEYYLIAFVPAVVTGVVALVLYGTAVRFRWPTAWIAVAYGLGSFSYASGGVANTLWATAAFPQWAAAALAVVAGLPYALSFAMTQALMPWLQSQGYMAMTLQMAGVALMLGLVGVPVAFWGRSVRQYINSRWATYMAGGVRPQ